MACLIIPNASNGKPSILFQALLDSGIERDKAISIYKKSFHPSLENKPKDSNGEPLIDDLMKVAIDPNSVLQQVSSKDKRTPDQKLNDKLLSFLAPYGIQVEHVENMKERTGFDSNGIAFIMDKLILISKGKEKVDTLPEEVAHFAVELLGEDNPLIQRLTDLVDQTEIYKEVTEEYSELSPDMMKKEAIGKIIAKSIINNEKVETPKGFMQTLRMAWNRFMKYFKGMNHKDFLDEVDLIADTVASDILKGTLEGDTSNLTDIQLHQKEKAPKTVADKQTKFLKKSIKVLEGRLAQLKNLENKKEEVEALKKQLDKIKLLLDNKKIARGLEAFVNSVNTEIEPLTTYMERYKKGELHSGLTTRRVANMGAFINSYSKLIDEVIITLDFDPVLREELSEVLDKAKGIKSTLDDMTVFYKVARKETATAAVLRANNGRLDNLDDEIFDNSVDKDVSIVRRWVGTMKNATDPVLKIIYDTVKRIKNEVGKYSFDVGRELIAAQEEMQAAGFNDIGAFFERDSNGKKTGYIVSKNNLGDYYAALEKFKGELAEKLGAETYAEVDIEHVKATPKLYKIYKKEWANHLKTKSLENFPSPAYEKIRNNPAAFKYYNKVMSIKNNEDSKIPVGSSERQRYLAPQLRKDALERLRNKDGSLIANAVEIFKEGVTLTEDDIEFNQREAFTDALGGEIRFIPVHYTNKLKDMDNLSEDLSSMMIAYATMAENYKQSYDIVPELELIREEVGERKLTGKNPKKGLETNTYAMLSDFMDRHLYGNIKKKDQILSVNINGKQKQINYGKALDTFNSYVRRNNLAFNMFATTASYTTGSIFSKIEDLVGQYSNQESKLFAEKEFDLQVMQVMSQIGKKRPTNKMHLMFMRNGFVDANHNDLNVDTVAGREIKNIFFSTYQMVDYRVKGKIALALMDNMRYIDGNWVTKDQFKRKHKELEKSEVNDKWAANRDNSFYNAHEVVDGELTVKDEFKDKVTPEIENNLKNRIEHIGNRADGMISELDRGAIFQSVWGRLLMTHRGWLVKGIEDRFKTGDQNLDTGEYEEGHYRTVGSLVAMPLAEIVSEMFHNRKLSLKPYVAKWETLNEGQRKNVTRSIAEMGSIAAIWILIKVLEEAIGDDDDDYLTQFGLYSLYRTKMELGAFYNPAELPKILKSPAAGINQMESMMDAFTLPFTWDEEKGGWGPFHEIERGRYKGKTKAERLMLQRSFAKNFYDAGYPGDKLKYVKQF